MADHSKMKLGRKAIKTDSRTLALPSTSPRRFRRRRPPPTGPKASPVGA